MNDSCLLIRVIKQRKKLLDLVILPHKSGTLCMCFPEFCIRRKTVHHNNNTLNSTLVKQWTRLVYSFLVFRILPKFIHIVSFPKNAYLICLYISWLSCYFIIQDKALYTSWSSWYFIIQDKALYVPWLSSLSYREINPHILTT